MYYFLRFITLIFFLLSIVLTKASLANNQKDENLWEEHSENITILSIEEVYEIVNKKNAILIDVWKKDERPKNLDKKKWFPPRRYTIPGAFWLPNIGRETLTSDIRTYLSVGLENITKNNKNEKIVFFCRRGYYSKIAAERAVKLGYTNIYLFPGTDLWEDRGHRLVIVNAESYK